MDPYTQKKESERKERFSDIRKREGGYFTVFVCLLFLAVSAAAFACLEGILLFQGKSQSVMLSTGVGEHLMANYSEPLNRKYHLYYLDPRMEQNMEKRALRYLDEVLKAPGILTGRRSAPFLSAEYVKVYAYHSMDRDDHSSFKAQINEFMKYELAKDAWNKLLSGTAKEAAGQQKEVEDLMDSLEQSHLSEETQDENADTALIPSNSAKEEIVRTAGKSGPLKTVSQILKGGVFEYVTEGLSLSDRSISSSQLSSRRKKEKKITWSFQLFENVQALKEVLQIHDYEQLKEGLKEKASMSFYNKKYFSNLKNRKKETELYYEYEYILGGYMSDRENLKHVVDRLILLRFGVNAAAVFTDPVKTKEAQTAALAIAGFTGSPALIETVRYAILAAISFTRSAEDVKALLQGERVPFFKEKEEGEREGFLYEEYLMFLFCIGGDENRYCYRMQDLMQINIQKEQPDFLIGECFDTIKVELGMKQKMVFFPGTYEFFREGEYCYE